MKRHDKKTHKKSRGTDTKYEKYRRSKQGYEGTQKQMEYRAKWTNKKKGTAKNKRNIYIYVYKY